MLRADGADLVLARRRSRRRCASRLELDARRRELRRVRAPARTSSRATIDAGDRPAGAGRVRAAARRPAPLTVADSTAPELWSALVDVYQPVLRDVVTELERDAGHRLRHLLRARVPRPRRRLDAPPRAPGPDAGALQPAGAEPARAADGGRRPGRSASRRRGSSRRDGAPDRGPAGTRSTARARGLRPRARAAPRRVRRRRRRAALTDALGRLAAARTAPDLSGEDVPGRPHARGRSPDPVVDRAGPPRRSCRDAHRAAR